MEFFQHPDIKKLMKLLNGKSRAPLPPAMFVGGCVRDYILNIPIKDIDVATTHKPQSVLKLLKNDFKMIPVGIEHGTVLAVTKVGPVQITTLRKDIETNGRHAVVSFTDDWAEDAARRDFTINTLLMDMQERVYDPLDAAIPDLKKSAVRFVGNAKDRVREDVLRILRYVRFHARFGQGSLSKDYLKIFASEKKLFQNLSRERITDEILKILSYSSAFKHLENFEDTKLLPLPKISTEQIKMFKILNECGENGQALALALWAKGSKAQWESIKGYLKLSNALVGQVESIIDGQKALRSFDKQNYLLLLYRYKSELARQILIFSLLQSGNTSAKIKAQLKKFDALSTPVFPITGKDLIARGYKAGPELGKKLRSLEQAWIKSGFKSVSLGAAPRR